MTVLVLTGQRLYTGRDLRENEVEGIPSLVTNKFAQYHNESVLKKYTERLKIGQVEEKAKL